MDSKVGLVLALVIMAAAVAMPMAETDAADSAVNFYKNQLSENELIVYKEVSASSGKADESSLTFHAELKLNNLFDAKDKAETYAEYTVNNALAALYLTDPMVAYLWDYPVKEVEVVVDLATIISTVGEETVASYAVKAVEFTLTLPSDITSESMTALEEALSKIVISGNTDAEKVTSIMSYLNGLTFQQDEEGTVSNIYDALVEKKTTSFGVSQAFNKLCSKNGVTSVSVCGTNILAANETKSCWNCVYLEGDIDGETKKSWYMVDPTYAVKTGIAGYLTEVEFNGKVYSMSAAHYTDLTLSAPNGLSAPQVTKDAYVQVGGPSFFQRYGEPLLLAALGVVLVVGMLYAVRSGNI